MMPGSTDLVYSVFPRHHSALAVNEHLTFNERSPFQVSDGNLTRMPQAEEPATSDCFQAASPPAEILVPAAPSGPQSTASLSRHIEAGHRRRRASS